MNQIQSIEEIKSRIDIVDFISEYVALKKSGQNYKGLCPFHSEKTPSFMVSHSKQIFHCFGCGKGGDIFAFIMNYDNLSFSEAALTLADKAGVKINDFKDNQSKKGFKEILLNIQKEALNFFKDNLTKSSGALNYLKGRGINQESVEKFSIGYATKHKDSIFCHLKSKGFKDEQIRSSGLVYFGEKTIYDFFRDRIMFPIFDIQNRVIAFGGRTMMLSKEIPKYINSPETIIFKKGEVNYGINIAKNFITQKGYAIITEGYLDVIMCHQFGFHNVIAPLGTAITLEHLKKIKKFSDKIVLVFDGDSAGIAATKRAIEIAYIAGLLSKITILSNNDDPDIFLRKYGETKFKKYLSGALTPSKFLLKIFGKNKIDGVKYALNIISHSTDIIQRNEAIKEIAELSGINEGIIREEIKNLINKPFYRKKIDSNNLLKNIQSGLNKEEEMLLNIIVSYPDKIKYVLNNLNVEDFENQDAKSIIKKIQENSLEFLGVGNLISKSSLEEQSFIAKCCINPQMDIEDIDKSMNDCIKKIILRNLEKKIKQEEEFAKKSQNTNLLKDLHNKKFSLIKYSFDKQG